MREGTALVWDTVGSLEEGDMPRTQAALRREACGPIKIPRLCPHPRQAGEVLGAEGDGSSRPWIRHVQTLSRPDALALQPIAPTLLCGPPLIQDWARALLTERQLRTPHKNLLPLPRWWLTSGERADHASSMARWGVKLCAQPWRRLVPEGRWLRPRWTSGGRRVCSGTWAQE